MPDDLTALIARIDAAERDCMIEYQDGKCRFDRNGFGGLAELLRDVRDALERARFGQGEAPYKAEMIEWRRAARIARTALQNMAVFAHGALGHEGAFEACGSDTCRTNREAILPTPEQAAQAQPAPPSASELETRARALCHIADDYDLRDQIHGLQPDFADAVEALADALPSWLPAPPADPARPAPEEPQPHAPACSCRACLQQLATPPER